MSRTNFPGAGGGMHRSLVVTLPVAALLIASLAFPFGVARAVEPSFSNIPLLRPEGGAEPAITVGADGTVIISGLNASLGLENFFTHVWKGPFGSEPAYQGPMDAHIGRAVGGADADVDLGSTGTFHGTSLVLTFNPKFSQAQFGISAVTCPNADASDAFAHCRAQLIDTAGTDRPFITSAGPEVYIAYHDAENSNLIRVQQSDDDGITWRRFAGPVIGQGKVTATATFLNQLGPIVADPTTHDVYELLAEGTTAANKGRNNIVLSVVYVARSTDRGRTWTSAKVYQGAPGQNFENPFPGGLAIDPMTGVLSAAWSDGTSIFFSDSTDHGSTWSSTRVVNAAPAATAVFPALASYGGTVDLVYYGTTSASRNDATAAWNVYLAQSHDSGGHFTQSQVTDRTNHVGAICTEGAACPPGTRLLADLFEVAINPQNGLAAIAYTADTFGHRFRIDSGPKAGEYPSQEGAFTRSIITLPDREMNGPTTYVGTAGCSGTVAPPAPEDADPNRDQIAVILGASGCRFDAQAQAAINAGYEGIVVVNPFDDRLFTMIGDPRDIPGVFVGLSTGLAIFNAASVSNLSVGATGAPVSVGSQLPQVVLAQQAH